MRNNIDVESVIEQMQGKVREAVEQGVIMVEADAKLLSPVLTGTLKRSITHDVEQSESITKGTVGTNVEYAIFAEKSKPFLEPAVDMNINEIQELIRRKLTE